MKVRCVKIINIDREEVEEDQYVSIGHEYIVLCLFASVDRPLVQLALGEWKNPYLYDARMFETVCNKIPSSWRAVVRSDGLINVGPESWLRPMFWDDLYGNEGSSEEATLRAVADYRRELALLLEESE
jgi:hypothetical protein